MLFIFESHSSNVSLFIDANARLILAFRPAGGSLVILIQRLRRPIGMALEASEDKKSLNLRVRSRGLVDG